MYYQKQHVSIPDGISSSLLDLGISTKSEIVVACHVKALHTVHSYVLAHLPNQRGFSIKSFSLTKTCIVFNLSRKNGWIESWVILVEWRNEGLRVPLGQKLFLFIVGQSDFPRFYTSPALAANHQVCPLLSFY